MIHSKHQENVHSYFIKMMNNYSIYTITAYLTLTHLDHINAYLVLEITALIYTCTRTRQKQVNDLLQL